ncbi:MAG: XdhC family protein [Oligoflexia bacterium]|nr:XdhC family protein [Oligoflexia bacterium]
MPNFHTLNLIEMAATKVREKKKVAIITVVKVKGSAPQIPGAKMLLVAEEINNSVDTGINDNIESFSGTYGTIGGGNLEYQALKEAREIMRENVAHQHRIHYFEKDLHRDLGMVCGGEITYIIELLSPPDQLIICGAGHCGLALYQMAKYLDFSITMIDARKEYADAQLFTKADLIVDSFDEEVLSQKLRCDQNTFIVIVSKDHPTDFKLVRYFLNKEWKYLGVIASKSKACSLKNELSKEGYLTEKIEKICAPIGLEIGGSTPAEIAVSILAQILQFRILQ